MAANVPIIRTADSVACSRDGSTIVTGGSEMVVKLWDARTRQLKRSLKGHKMQIQKVAISPDGTLVASASDSGTVWQWYVNTGKQKSVTSGKGEWNCEMAYSPDGSVLAVNGSVCVEGQSYDAIRILDAQTGKQIRLIKDKYGCPSIAFATHGSEIVREQDGLRFLQVR